MIRISIILLLILSLQIQAQQPTIEALGLKAPSKTKCTEVKDQSLSSTCWSFASCSLLESEMIKVGKGGIDLSEMFIARYSYLRKIERHLKLKGANFFTPGGQFHDVIWVIKNFGMVPESAYPGRPEGMFHHNHAELDTAIARFVREMLKMGVTHMSQDDSDYLNELLDKYLGPVPETFEYEGLVYTPHSFPSRVMEINPDDYIEITSYSHHPWYSRFVLEDKYNWTGDSYFNVPLADLMSLTKEAIRQGYTVGWDGDADDPGFNFYGGMAYLPPVTGDMVSARQIAFEDQSTLLNHLMHVVAISNDKSGKPWFYVKNSWGSGNNSGGYLFMNESYFRLRTVAIIVNKNAIPTAIRVKMGI